MARPTEGFSLLEAVVVIAVMAILAAAALPLAMKSMNQQAETTTRANAQVAYNAIFGARDHRVSNMMADFGYIPTAGADLRDLVTLPVGMVAWGAGPAFSWGWNGPYWNGSTGTFGGVVMPVDAWGHAFVLQGAGGNWQVVSGGADGNVATAADNIVYPTVAAPIGMPVLTLTVANNRVPGPNPISGTVAITDRNGTNLLATQTGGGNFTLTNLASGGTFPIGAAGQVTVHPGPVSITINITTAPAITLSQVVDLLPGQNYSYTYNVN